MTIGQCYDWGSGLGSGSGYGSVNGMATWRDSMTPDNEEKPTAQMM